MTLPLIFVLFCFVFVLLSYGASLIVCTVFIEGVRWSCHPVDPFQKAEGISVKQRFFCAKKNYFLSLQARKVLVDFGQNASAVCNFISITFDLAINITADKSSTLNFSSLFWLFKKSCHGNIVISHAKGNLLLMTYLSLSVLEIRKTLFGVYWKDKTKLTRLKLARLT